MKKDIMTKHTKIVATLGPSSEAVQVLEDMIRAGLNVARFNFSHGEYEWHEQVMSNVREASKNVGVPVAILADLQGPRVRTRVEDEMEIKSGDIVRICDISLSEEKKKEISKDFQVITLDCPNIIEELNIGNSILIEDGLMRLNVVDITDNYAVTEVIDGGVVKNHKGVNIPDASIPLPTVTKKDYDDLAFALSQGVDFIAMSFVRNGQDIVNLRKHIQKIIGEEEIMPRIVSKIECKEALRNLDRILGATDAVMIARGDLGIEADPSKVTILEKDILKKSIQHLRPTIVATQMLASMEHNARPTRAEVADVTNAVADHTDAVMLSGETSMGKYPVETVKTMAQIATETEISPYDDVLDVMPLTFSSEEVRIAKATHDFSKELNAAAIIIFSESGYTARLLSHFRPEREILVATNKPKTYNQLALAWGIFPFLHATEEKRKKCIQKTIDEARDRGILHAQDLVITVLGSTKAGKKLELVGTRIV